MAFRTPSVIFAGPESRNGHTAHAMRIALPLILFAATLCFALGIVLPLNRVERLYFFTDAPSLAGIVLALWTEGDWLLAAAVGLFSIVFPSLKLALLHVAMHGGAETHARLPAWVRGLANWSMLDVLLVALVIFAAKTSGLATAFTRPGLWFFALSVVLTATATALLNRHSSAKGYSDQGMASEGGTRSRKLNRDQ